MDTSLILNNELPFNFEINGNLLNEEYIISTIKKLESINNKEISIYLKDIEYLPQKILKSIISINNLKKIRVYTSNEKLYNYLVSLSLNINSLKDNELGFIEVLVIIINNENIMYLSYLLEQITNISIFIINSTDLDLKSRINEFSNRDFLLQEIQNDIELDKNQIYLLNKNFFLKITNHKYIFKTINNENYNIIEFLSEKYKNNLKIIILSSENNIDFNKIKKINNTKIIIQDPEESEKNKYLLGKLKNDSYDYVMPIYEIKEYIKRHINKNYNLSNDIDIEDFLKDIKDKYGYDYKNYSKDIVLKMIEKSMKNIKIDRFDEFKNIVINNKDIFKSLFFNLSINFTEFFRDHEVFKYIKEYIFNYIKSSQNIKIWCIGCSTGEEAYSLSMLLNDVNLLNKTTIYATDINHLVIEYAKNGLFSKDKIRESESAYIKSGGVNNFMDYFTDLGTCYEINDIIREKVMFFEYSILNKGIINEFDIIFCRNVLIYFNDKLIDETINSLYNSIKNNGFLVLGKNEDLIENNKFISYNNTYKVYKKAHF